MSLIGLCALLTVLYLSLPWLWRCFSFYCRSFPPGPVGLPVIGNLLQFGSQAHVTFLKWSRKYGDIFSVQIGPRTAIVLNKHHAIREALVKNGKDFNHRAPVSLLRLEAGGLGILNNEGPVWSEVRKFTLACLKDKGFGKVSLEGQILDEITEFNNDMQSSDGEPIDPRPCLTLSVANVLWSLVAGHRFHRKDPKLMELADMNDAIVRSIGNVGVMTFFPQLRWVFRKKYNRLHEAMSNLRMFLSKEIKLHHEYRKAEEKRSCDLIDEFLEEANREMSIKNSTYFTDDQINAILLDLFVAGIETTVTSVRWALRILVEHPNLQREVQREIDDVVGSERYPCTEDRPRMPLTEAALAEIMRISCVVPIFFHSTADHTTLRNFKIPRHTPVLVNNWSCHRDPDVWNNPDEFDSSRFLDAEGRFCKSESFQPFGIGRRACPGESLARTELFLIITCILQKFILLKPPGKELSTKVLSGLVVSPYPFDIIFRLR